MNLRASGVDRAVLWFLIAAVLIFVLWATAVSA